MSEVRWFDVADDGEVWQDDLLDFNVGGDQIMIARLAGGELKAYQAMCPHQEIPLADGEWDPDSCALTCGGHAWIFDLHDGKGTNPVGSQLYEYQVRVVNEKIQVAIPQDGERHYYRFAVGTEEGQ